MGLFKKIVSVVKKVAPLAVGFIPVVGPAASIALKVRSAAMAANKLRKGIVAQRQAKRAAGQMPALGAGSQFIGAVRRRRAPMRRRPPRRRAPPRRRKWA